MEVVKMLNFAFAIVIYLCFSMDFVGSILLPRLPEGPNMPICTSYNGLCHLMFNITDPHQTVNSHQQICRCPDTPCDIAWEDTGRSITKVFKFAGQEVEIKMSYCTMQQPDNVCRQNEDALITRGRGPFTFEIVSDFRFKDNELEGSLRHMFLVYMRCRCYRQLYPTRSWRMGDYNYFEYSCGKPRCGINRSPRSECMRITYDSPNNLIHEYFCRCRRNEECIGGPLPTATNPVTMRTCQRLSDQELDRRRFARRLSRHLRQK